MRLKGFCSSISFISSTLFLFQIGAIKRMIVFVGIILAASFYSKLVRLKVMLMIGAIKRVSLNNFTRFNSFYSKLVRLKDFLQFVYDGFHLFLFQIGAIKSSYAHASQKCAVECFYSKLVRLKGVDERRVIYPHRFLFQIGAIKSIDCDKIGFTFFVSIPNWCD